VISTTDDLKIFRRKPLKEDLIDLSTRVENMQAKQSMCKTINRTWQILLIFDRILVTIYQNGPLASLNQQFKLKVYLQKLAAHLK